MMGGSLWLLRTSGTFGSVFVIKKLLIISHTVKCASWELTINVKNVFFSNGHMTIFSISKKYLFLCNPYCFVCNYHNHIKPTYTWMYMYTQIWTVNGDVCLIEWYQPEEHVGHEHFMVNGSTCSNLMVFICLQVLFIYLHHIPYLCSLLFRRQGDYSMVLKIMTWFSSSNEEDTKCYDHHCSIYFIKKRLKLLLFYSCPWIVDNKFVGVSFICHYHI